MAKYPSYPRRSSLRREESAARVLGVISVQPGRMFTKEELCARTNMTRQQVGRGERYLKEFFNEHNEQIPEWTLHIAIGPVSRHGLTQDADMSLLDAVARLKQGSARAESELNYREQQIARVADPLVRRRLVSGITYQRAASQAYEDAYERLVARS